MSAKMKKKIHQKMDQKVSFFASFLHYCCPLQPSQPKPSQAKQNQNNNCVSKQKGNEYLRIPVTRVI